MYWLDWIIVAIPLLIVLIVSIKTQKYVKGVSDFLAAGRVAGRYVLAVAGDEANMGLISVIATVEMYYASGFGFGFWNKIITPLGLLFALTGFCTYRYRETKAMTMGQLLEMRYSRSFRICAAIVQSASGILNYAIFPAVGARFLIYFLDLPIYLNFFGWHFPTFGLLLIICIGIGAFIACIGGQVTIMVSDCIQGILSYPMYLIIVAYFLYRFSWSGDILPTLLDRPAGMSFLNPYDIKNLRDFNLFYVFAGIFGSFFGRLSWCGAQGYSGAAKNPHEQKMGGLLGTWRGGFSIMMIVLLALVTYTYMHNPKFQSGRTGANEVNRQLAQKTLSDVAGESRYDAVRTEIARKIDEAQPRRPVEHNSKIVPALDKTVDNYKAVAAAELQKVNPKLSHTFDTIHNQMLASLTMREILPIGITGIFAAIMIFLMISTDNTYMHSWGSILIQDIVLPIYNKPITPKQQLTLLRCGIVFVALFAFFFSFFFAQLDYIIMFFMITGAIWVGGGVVITLGLYWRRGTSAGAFAGLLGGAAFAVSGILAQQNWSNHIYPWLVEHGKVETVAKIFHNLSRPFNPYIVWEMNPVKFPINSKELAFLGLLAALLFYVVVSLLTCRKPFNLEKMLRRGIYSEDGIGKPVEKISLKKFFKGLIGITPEYTRGDKVLAWSVFSYSLIYGFGICFLVPVIWNLFYRWPSSWWGVYFWINSIFVVCLIGIVSTFWFAIGGTIDLHRLFKALAEKKEDVLDDGRVIGNVTAADAARIEAAEKKSAAGKQ